MTNYCGACYEIHAGTARVWRDRDDHARGKLHDWQVATSDYERVRATIDREHDFGFGGRNGIACDPDVIVVDAASIRAFLTLPSDCLPSADWGRQCDMEGIDPWSALRERADGGPIVWDEEIVLRADRDGWREYRRVLV